MFLDGQTGSGKTYTMMGEKGDEQGIIPRLIEAIFMYIEDTDDDMEFTVNLLIHFMQTDVRPACTLVNSPLSFSLMNS